MRMVEKPETQFGKQETQVSEVPNQCPFCKSQKLIPKFNYVFCLECEAEGPFAETQEEAIRAWNQREPDDATRAMLDRSLSDVKSEWGLPSERRIKEAFLKAWNWPREEKPCT
jgi:hypothetical protein